MSNLTPNKKKELSYEEVRLRLINLRDSNPPRNNLQCRNCRLRLSDFAVALQDVFRITWWASGGYIEDVELSGKNALLQKVENVHFVRVSLRECMLSSLTFEKCVFEDCSFEGAQLRRITFAECSFPETSFQQAVLHDVDFSSATEFPATQLAGSDLTGSILPEAVNKFSGLAFVADVSRHAQRVFTILLLACAYCWIVLSTVTDAELLTSSRELSLPILQLGIPSQGFFAAGPVVILCIFVYLQLYLQRMWKNLAELPAIFNDGRALDDRADAWLIVSFVRKRLPFANLTGRSAWNPNFIVPILLTWVVAPSTIAWFWIRYLPAQHFPVTTIGLLCFLMSTLVGITAYQSAIRTLDRHKSNIRNSIRRRRIELVVVLRRNCVHRMRRFLRIIRFSSGLLPAGTPLAFMLTLFLTVVTVGVFQSSPRSPIPWLIAKISLMDYNVYPSIRDTQVSHSIIQKSPFLNHYVSPDDVIGARFGERRARYLDCQKSFLVSADLRNCDLTGSNFRGADLRGAHFDGAILTNADFTNAWLEEAVFDGAAMRGAVLDSLSISNQFSMKNVKDLTGAILGLEVWTNAVKDGTDFSWANFGRIESGDSSTWRAIKKNGETKPPKALY